VAKKTSDGKPKSRRKVERPRLMAGRCTERLTRAESKDMEAKDI
jgi:hypothetical protein